MSMPVCPLIFKYAILIVLFSVVSLVSIVVFVVASVVSFMSAMFKVGQEAWMRVDGDGT